MKEILYIRKGRDFGRAETINGEVRNTFVYLVFFTYIYNDYSWDIL